MSIKNDAGFILNVLYNKRVKNRNEKIGGKDIIRESEWDENRVYNALDYLCESSLVKIVRSPHTPYKLLLIHANGINLIEKEGEFERHFEMGFNFGIINFKWGAKER